MWLTKVIYGQTCEQRTFENQKLASISELYSEGNFSCKISAAYLQNGFYSQDNLYSEAVCSTGLTSTVLGLINWVTVLQTGIVLSAIFLRDDKMHYLFIEYWYLFDFDVIWVRSRFAWLHLVFYCTLKLWGKQTMRTIVHVHSATW